MPTPDLIAQLDALEAASRPLEPDADERARLYAAVGRLAESYNEGLAAAPAYRRTEDDARELLRHPIAETPHDLDEVLGLIERNLHQLGINSAHGGMMAYIPSSQLYYSALADFLAANANAFTAHSHSSPGAVRMENQLIRWMADLIGLPDSAGGNLTSGGSLATLAAFVAAREAAGLKSRDIETSVVYRSDQAHHAVPKGLKIAGLGDCVQRLVPVDDRWRLIPERLNEMITADRASGLRPWMVVANAGATNSGMVDPLAAIGEIANREGLWFHVDAAYGGFFLLCDEGRRRLAGIGLADSVVLDPHKSLFVPFGTGTVLVREARHLNDAFGFHGHYAQDALTRIHEPSPVEMSPELSRHFRGLRMWLPLMLVGVAPFRAALEEKLLLARYAWQRLSEVPEIEMGPAPDLSVVVFRWVGMAGGRQEGVDTDATADVAAAARADAFNARLIEALQADGRALLSSTQLDGKFVLRMALLSNRTHRADVDWAIEAVIACGRGLLAGGGAGSGGQPGFQLIYWHIVRLMPIHPV